jgi:hypothetical protein
MTGQFMGDNGNIAPVNLGCRVKQRTQMAFWNFYSIHEIVTETLVENVS